MRRAGLGVVALLAGLAVTSSARSSRAERVAVQMPSTNVAASGGQLAMSVRMLPGGAFAARACASAPCDLANVTPMGVPDSMRGEGPSSLIGPIELERHRRAVIVVSQARSGGTFLTVVAAPLASSHETTPLVLWSGLADRGEGRAPNVVELRSLESGTTQILIGERRDDIGTCGGRITLLAPKLVDPSDLTLKPAKIMRLSDTEIARATRLVAERRTQERAAPLGRILSASGASSAIGAPQAVTDGDLETTWSEAHGGEGRGELVTMRSSKDVPLTMLSFVPRPTSRVVEEGAAPKRFFVTTDDAVLAITMPEDAWQHPGARYDVKLPAPISTSCLAIVLDEAYAEPTNKSAAVTFAEVEARTTFDEGGDLPSLVGALAGGGARARGASALLSRGGAPALRAVVDGYASLDDAGRMLALDVADQAPCADASALFTRALGGSFEAEVIHGRTRLERCRRGAVPALLEALSTPAHPGRFLSADELSLIAPDEAVTALGPLVLAPDAKLRHAAREAFVRSVSSDRSAESLAKLLSSDSLAADVRARVLRLSGARVADPKVRASASAAVARFSGDSPERYLVLPAVAALAASGDEGALTMLRAALADSKVSLRTEAARVSPSVPAVLPRLAELAGDQEPRVREAVASAWRGPGAAIGTLAADEWTFVRIAAYDAIAASPADASLDGLLVRRLSEDVASKALTHAIDAIAKRNIAAASPVLSTLVKDEKRSLDVRLAAMLALGSVCDRTAVPWLTTLAERGASATAKSEDQLLAGGALSALGRLHPADLAARLAPFSGEGVAKAAKSAARAALEEKDVCR